MYKNVESYLSWSLDEVKWDGDGWDFFIRIEIYWEILSWNEILFLLEVVSECDNVLLILDPRILNEVN